MYYLQQPAIQMALLALPMICVLDAPLLHRVMTPGFVTAATRLLPVAIAISLLVSVYHPLKYAMGSAVMCSYIQWLAVRVLYLRFERHHNRPPRVAEERRELGSTRNDFVFRVGANLLVVGSPITIIPLLIWIVTSGQGLK